MRRPGLWRVVACSALVSLSAVACGDDDGEYLENFNPYPEEPSEEPPTPTIDELPAAETLSAGMSANVNVVIDRRGMPHIYAANLADALRAQGYIMARDRFPQMEFIRRAVTGTLTEAISPVAGTVTLQDDIQARFFGFKRVATQVYNGLDANDVVKVGVDAFTAGVNEWVDEILAEKAKGSAASFTRFVPRGTGLFQAVIASPFFGHWEPTDVMAIARYQTFVLSFDQSDADRSQALQGIGAGSFGNSPAEQQRGVGTLLDMAAYAPSRNVYTTDAAGPSAVGVHPARGLPAPALTSATGTTSTLRPMHPAAAAAAARFGAHARHLARLLGDVDRGSNNWVVSGAHTASGAPMLANDPHLSLTSPGVWYYTHITTTAEGIDAAGVSFAGLPSVVLGFTKDLAWGATVTNFDVVDFYAFQDTPSIGGGGAITVETNDGDVTVGPSAVEIVRAGPTSPTGDVTVPIYTIGNFGQVVFEGTTPQPVAVRTISFDQSNELGFFLRLLTAKTVTEARSAQATYFKAGSQNFVMIAKNGDIAWQTYSRIPTRPDLATAWPGPPAIPNDPANPLTTMCPTFVLPSSAAFTWTGDIEPTALPSLLNPAKGWIATANQDSIGVNRDGNPCNDTVYLGGDYDPGHRQFRIAERLTALVARGDITVADMQALQAASKSSLGETLRDPLVEILAAAIAEEDDPESVEAFQEIHDRLVAWTLETPAGVGSTDEAVIADSVATTIFNVWISRIIALGFGDEALLLGVRPPAAQLLERALTASAEDKKGLVTFNDALGNTILWDDMDTGDLETRDVIVMRALMEGVNALVDRFGEDRDQWLWGTLHTVKFKALIPPTSLDVQSIPAADDPRYANGFPRHSDWGAVDVGNYNLWTAYEVEPATGPGDDPDAVAKGSIDIGDFAYGGSGPSQRLVVEMLPDGPKAYNALPGGQSQYPDSKHHHDEAALWQKNQAPRLNFTPDEVAANAELKIVLTP
ncbi:MAG: penicillin acylase family protein [Myxococcota bacterium]